MDTTGFSQVGRYGTLSLLKRRSSTPNPNPNDLITSFGIDEAILTFGSTSTCGVRLYYSDVDPVHCQLTFEDGKAFLAVLGQAGVLIDGCYVYPHSSSNGGNRSTQEQQQQQAIVPLSNNSEFEIHQKRFRFTYPPKEVRRAILSTPAPAQKRALRLSMIHSAQVFSPRPSKDPRENLRILQSPLKQGIFPPQTPHNGKTPTRTRAVSPLKYSSKSESLSDDSSEEENEAEEEDNEDVEEEIVLVRTNHPRVVEEERDLVILEDVPLDIPPARRSGSPSRAQPSSSGQAEVAVPEPQVPRTPRRKSLGGTALHRAVLIRSAQRAVWRAEREKEEEEEREEEMEVLGAVVDPVEADMEEDEDEYADQDVEMRSVSSEDEETDEDEEDAEAIAQKVANKSLWRKSLERIIPWGFSNAADREDEDENDEDEDPEQHAVEHEEEEEEEEENEDPAPLPVRPAETPVKRALGSFMTPQVHNPATQNVSQPKLGMFPAAERSNAPMVPPGLPEPSAAQAAAPAPGPGRYSLGGGEARRVLVQQPWRIKDLVVPPPVPTDGSPTRPTTSSAQQSATPMRETVGAISRPTPVVTDEERRAIQERRRSAVREFKEDNFWKDGAPGMSPSKGTSRMSLGGAPAKSVSPVKQGAATGDTDVAGPSMSLPKRPVFGSPTKGRALGFGIAEEGDSGVAEADDARGEEDQDEELDTRSLLDRMRETVEDMKRRRSVVASTPRSELASRDITNTVERSILTRAAPTPAGAPTSVALATPERPTEGAFSIGSVKKLDFSRINTPAMRAESAKPTSTPAVKDEDEDIMTDEDKAVMEEEPFSLLRPSTLEATPSSSRKPPSVGKKSTEQEDEEEVRAVPLPDVHVDEATEEEHQQEVVQKPKETKGKARGRPRLLRAPKAPVVTETVEDEETEEVQEPSRSQAKPKAAAKPRSRSAKSAAARVPTPEEEPLAALAPPVTRRQRSKTPQPLQQQELAPPATRTRRTRKGTAEPEEPAPAPIKKGKKAAPVEPEPEEDAEEEKEEKKVKTPAAKRGLQPRVAPAEAEHEDIPEPAPAAPVKRSRSRKAALEPEPQDKDDEEFESYEQRPATTTKTSSIPAKAPLKGRKKAAAVKDEPVEEETEAAPLATTKAGRTAAAKTPAASKLALPETAPSKIAKPRGKLKTPGSAPIAASRILAGSSSNTTSAEKENSRAGSGSNGSDDADEAPVKIRVSKRTAAATVASNDSVKTTKTSIPRSVPKTAAKAVVKSKVKVEEAQEEEVGRGRTTRATRTRTKTG